ncbi:Gfo/Idh/MocA family oxidoreductase [Labrys monachus]|uniref:Ornithine cyclodeaminase n=1 Tax=Labrys monachus TaxID=217067 RepID=A0ABU0F774_9HYPH|nr:Gfo/Idh/MocA family oxidoreductase [Labrys monachus]MDQ0390463.1 ornithine cyclodeaminase [Labrys monachus]
MQMIDADAVHRLLDYEGLVEALRRAHRGAMPETGEICLSDPGQPAVARHFLALPAWQAGDMLGIKLATSFPENEHLPSIQGLYAAFDGRTGAPILIADGTALTLRKTAADSALGADLLARPDAETMLMIGAGALAPHVIAAFLAVRPGLRRIAIWNRTAARAEQLAARLSIAGVAVAAVADLDAALGEADIVSCATMTASPLVRGGLLKPGAHVDLIGGWHPGMREADDDAIRRSSIYVDSKALSGDCGDIRQPLDQGLLRIEDIRGDLFSLCAGDAPGRAGPDEITLFKNAGGGHLDLFTARHLARRAGIVTAP